MSVIALHPGAEFAGRYEVVRCIQLGGMGAVYEVVHLETRRRRALKVMLPSVVESEELRARFKLEATVAADVVSDHIVETFDAGIDAETGAPFLVMELLRGVELGSLIKETGPLAPADVVAVLRQVARGLDKTHAAGVVHRDLKPENVYLSARDDGLLWVKLLDFGVAKVVADVTSPAKTKVMGTPLYMAPEQLTGDGRIGPAADLYALGHLAFRLLAGRAYWKDEADAAASIFNFLLQVMDGHPEPATARARGLGVELPEAFDGWFDRATAKDPSERHPDALSQIDGLVEALGTPPDGETTDAFVAAFGDCLADVESRRAPMVGGSIPPAGKLPSGHSSSDFSSRSDLETSETEIEPGLGSARTQQPLTRDPPPPTASGGGARLAIAAGVVVAAGLGLVVAFGRGDAPAPATTAPAATSSSSAAVAPPAAPSSSEPSGSATEPVASASPAASLAPPAATPAPPPPPTWRPPPVRPVPPPPPPPPLPPPADDPLKIR